MEEKKKIITKTQGIFISGFFQALVFGIAGHPLETIKTILQTNNAKITNYQCFRQILQQQGIKGLYRGFFIPLISHITKRPVQFTLQQELYNYLQTEKKWKQNVALYTSAGIASTSCFFYTIPLEVIKTNLQITTRNQLGGGGVCEFVKQHYKKYGFVGFYQGGISTCVKDLSHGSCFWGSYFLLKEKVFYQSQNYLLNALLAGSSASLFQWSLLMPIDCIRNNIVAAKGKYSFRETVIEIYARTGKISVFWTGYYSQCLRVLPCSGVAIMTFEYVKEKIK